jgi:hypothetical protein
VTAMLARIGMSIGAGVAACVVGGVPLAARFAMNALPDGRLAWLLLMSLPLVTAGAAVATALAPQRRLRAALIGGLPGFLASPIGFMAMIVFMLHVPPIDLGLPARNAISWAFVTAPGGALVGTLVAVGARTGGALRMALAGAVGLGAAAALGTLVFDRAPRLLTPAMTQGLATGATLLLVCALLGAGLGFALGAASQAR